MHESLFLQVEFSHIPFYMRSLDEGKIVSPFIIFTETDWFNNFNTILTNNKKKNIFLNTDFVEMEKAIPKILSSLQDKIKYWRRPIISFGFHILL